MATGIPWTVVVAVIFSCWPVMTSSSVEVEVRAVKAPNPTPYYTWPSEPPPDCPFPPSEKWIDIGFTGRHAEYTWADTWYPSWGADNRLYSCFTDGSVDGVHASSFGGNPVVGHAIIEGDNPLELKIVEPGVIPGRAAPYGGRYPSANLFYKGIWYIGTYCLAPAGRVVTNGIIYNWPWLGPFVGFHISRDGGKTWEQCPHTPERPIFGESALHGEPVKFGAAHVVDFGQELEHSPDGKVYLVSHGASRGPEGRRFGYNSWITGDEVYLARVQPGPEYMNNSEMYEFFAGYDERGIPRWTHKVQDARPIARWDDHMGCVTITYNSALKCYLMCVTDGRVTSSYYHTYILESDRITGPYRLVSFLRRFGEQAYFVNIPSKFISKDGMTMWLCYAANFARDWNNPPLVSYPPGSRYGMCLQEVRLIPRGEKIPENPLLTRTNIARIAQITVSSTYPGYSVEGLFDGYVDGYPNGIRHEWATKGEGAGAMVRLTWDRPWSINRIWLFDRPNNLDQVQEALLVFPDGFTVRIPQLADDASEGVEVVFSPRKVRWLAILITRVKDSTQNIGFSELAVFTTEKW